MQAALVFLFVLAFLGQVEAGAKEECISKVRKWVTSFATVAQMNTLAGAGVNLAVDQAATDDIQTVITNKAMEILSTEQYVTAMNLFSEAINKFGSMGAVTSTALKCATGAKSLITPLYAKLKTKLDAASTKTAAEQKNIVFNFVNKKFTLAFAKTVGKACKQALTADEWTKGRAVVAPILKLSQLGL